VAERDCLLSSVLDQNLAGHKVKENRQVETNVSRWLVTLDTDFYQQRREKPVSRHGKYRSYGENYVEKE